MAIAIVLGAGGIGFWTAFGLWIAAAVSALEAVLVYFAISVGLTGAGLIAAQRKPSLVRAIRTERGSPAGWG